MIGHLRVSKPPPVVAGQCCGAVGSKLNLHGPATLADAAMKLFLLRFFTWWNGSTFGTQLWTRRFGEFVGTDESGNRYYRTKGGKIDPALGFERRWVIYEG